MNITINLSDVFYEPDIENLEKIVKGLRDTLEKQKENQKKELEKLRGIGISEQLGGAFINRGKI